MGTLLMDNYKSCTSLVTLLEDFTLVASALGWPGPSTSTLILDGGQGQVKACNAKHTACKYLPNRQYSIFYILCIIHSNNNRFLDYWILSNILLINSYIQCRFEYLTKSVCHPGSLLSTFGFTFGHSPGGKCQAGVCQDSTSPRVGAFQITSMPCAPQFCTQMQGPTSHAHIRTTMARVQSRDKSTSSGNSWNE